MAQLNPYLHFDGNCREAMTFYKSCLGGELEIQSVGESPMASDMMGPGGVQKGNEVSLTISGSNKEEIESFFSRLAAGGKVTHPLKEEFFGLYGDLTDKFGVNWMFNYQKPRT
jgi:PhnB protein